MKLEFNINFFGDGCCSLRFGRYFVALGFNGTTMLCTPKTSHFWMHPSSSAHEFYGAYRRIDWV